MFDLTSWFVAEGQKEGWIYLGLWNHAKAVNSQSWTFETNYTQKLHFYAVCGHKQPPDDQTIKLCPSNSESYDRRRFLGPSLGESEFYITGGSSLICNIFWKKMYFLSTDDR